MCSARLRVDNVRSVNGVVSESPRQGVTTSHNRARLDFENSEAFRERLDIRHRIEEKNGEMKVAHGLARADSMGLDAVRLQTYFTVLAVNVKRMVKLLGDRPFALCYAYKSGVFIRIFILFYAFLMH